MAFHSHPGLQGIFEIKRLIDRPPHFALLGESFHMGTLVPTENPLPFRNLWGSSLPGYSWNTLLSTTSAQASLEVTLTELFRG